MRVTLLVMLLDVVKGVHTEPENLPTNSLIIKVLPIPLQLEEAGGETRRDLPTDDSRA